MDWQQIEEFIQKARVKVLLSKEGEERDALDQLLVSIGQIKENYDVFACVDSDLADSYAEMVNGVLGMTLDNNVEGLEKFTESVKKYLERRRRD